MTNASRQKGAIAKPNGFASERELMSFLAECPYCRLKLRNVPDERAGASTSCPRCGNAFTLAGSDRVVTVIKAERTAVAPSHAAGVPLPKRRKSYWDPQPLKAVMARQKRREKPPTLTSPASPAEVSAPPAPEGPRPINRIGVLAFLLASLAVPVASLPRGNWVSLALAAVGAVTGLLGLLHAWRRFRGVRSAIVALAVSVPTMLVILFAPGLLQQPPLVQHQAPASPPLVVALGKNDGLPLRHVNDGWITALQEAYQKDDVRVRITSLAVNLRRRPEEKQQTASLEIGVRTINLGAVRRIPYAGWGGSATDRPLLVDGQGTPCRQRSPTASLPARNIAPGKWIDETIVFEMASRDAEYWRLTLPLSALGGDGKIQFQINKQQLAEKR